MLSFYWPFIKQLFSIAKKALLVIIVFVAIISFFLYFIAKDKPKITQNPQDSVQKNRAEIYKTLNDPKLNQTREGKIMAGIYRTITCSAFGEACTDNPNDGNKNYKNSIFGFMSNLIILPYVNPPASGVYWLATSLQNAGFIPKTYAAEGIGFGALKPFINLWKVFRDVSYMLLVLILVIIGFMIMFRMKLNPQTVISVENALPKIVISLLLITFSFAIAGFLIDLMYVVIAIAISLMSNNNMYYDAGQFQKEFLTADTIKLAGAMFPAKDNSFMASGLGLFMNLGNALLSLLGPFNGILRGLLGGAGLLIGVLKTDQWFGWLIHAFDNTAAVSGKIPGLILGALIIPTVSVLLGAIGAFLIPQLIIAILVLFTALLLFFRIFSLLIKAYINILIMVIFSPLFMLFEAIPGRSAFSYWFKNLLAELLTFPIVIILFLVGYVIVNNLITPATSIWTPPFFGGIDPAAFSLIVGMAIIFMIPDFVKQVKELLGVKGLPLGFGAGTFFGGAATALGGSMGVLGQFGSITLGLGAVGKMLSVKQKGPRGMAGALFGNEDLFKAKEKVKEASATTTGLGNETET